VRLKICDSQIWNCWRPLVRVFSPSQRGFWSSSLHGSGHVGRVRGRWVGVANMQRALRWVLSRKGHECFWFAQNFGRASEALGLRVRAHCHGPAQGMRHSPVEFIKGRKRREATRLIAAERVSGQRSALARPGFTSCDRRSGAGLSTNRSMELRQANMRARRGESFGEPRRDTQYSIARRGRCCRPTTDAQVLGTALIQTRICRCRYGETTRHNSGFSCWGFVAQVFSFFFWGYR